MFSEKVHPALATSGCRAADVTGASVISHVIWQWTHCDLLWVLFISFFVVVSLCSGSNVSFFFYFFLCVLSSAASNVSSTCPIIPFSSTSSSPHLQSSSQVSNAPAPHRESISTYIYPTSGAWNLWVITAVSCQHEAISSSVVLMPCCCCLGDLMTGTILKKGSFKMLLTWFSITLQLYFVCVPCFVLWLMGIYCALLKLPLISCVTLFPQECVLHFFIII